MCPSVAVTVFSFVSREPWRDAAVGRRLPSWFWGSGSAAAWDTSMLSMSHSSSTQGFPGSQLLWRGHWLQHQALREHVAFPAPVSAVGSFFSARLWAYWQLCEQPAAEAQAASSTHFLQCMARRQDAPLPSSSFPSMRRLHMKCLQRLHLLCNVPCILENSFTPNSTDAVTPLQSSGL